MIARLLRFALSQRFVMLVLALALIAVGLWSFQQLKIEAYPDISDTQTVVITLYPGHAAEEVEQQVTVPIERVLNSVPHVIARRSRTIFGLSVVELTFDYGFPYSEWRSHPCRCGAKRCVGFIVNKAQRWRVRKILRGRKSLKQS